MTAVYEGPAAAESFDVQVEYRLQKSILTDMVFEKVRS